jgi:hypothetical protein
MSEADDWMLREDRDLLVAREDEWRKSWGRTRSHGKYRFILRRYVLVWGGVQVGLAVILHLDWFRGPRAGYMYGCGAFILLIAFLLGLWEWESNEKRYRRDG